jgi:hypothetical protein
MRRDDSQAIRTSPPIPLSTKWRGGGAEGEVRWLAVVIALFVALGTVYSLVTPIFEASDERWHYPVVRYIADRHRLPVQDASKRTDWHQEGSQPPLYYLLGAALTAGVDGGDYDHVYAPNPHAVVGEPLVIGNKNMMIHTGREDWPWRRTSLAVHLIRLLSVMMGAVTVWLTYHIARCVWPGDGRAALLAAALTAFNPMFVFVNASVNNDNLAAPLAAAAVLVLVRALQRGQRTRDGVLLGILLGLGALTKLSTLALLPLSALALAWDAARRRRDGHPRTWRAWSVNMLLIGGLMAVIAGWWYWRNWMLYGDPTGISRMLEIAGRRHEPLTLDRLWYEFEGFRITYWGLFGALNILVDRWIYTALDVLTAVAGLGLIMAGARLTLTSSFRPFPLHMVDRAKEFEVGERPTGPRATPLILLIAWVGLVSVSLIRWTSLTYASQGRLMFVAIAGISSLLAVGLTALVPARLRGVAVAALGGAFFLLSAVCPFHYIAPAYERPPLLSQAQLPADMQRVNWDIYPVTNTGDHGAQMRLLGYRFERTDAPNALPTVHPFETLALTMYWEALAPMTTDYSVFVHLLGRDHVVVGQVNTFPGLGLWPTTQLRPGDVVADTYRVQVAADATAPTLLRIDAGLYRYDDPGRPALPALDVEGMQVEPLLATAKLVPWDWPEVEPAHRLAVRLGDAISLLGYDLAATAATQHRLTLYWQATGRPAADYTVFIQLWDAERQLAGFDGRPVHGDYPTDWWEAGEMIVDEHILDLGTQPAEHSRLLIGMYRLDTGERLPAIGPAGPLPDYAIELGLQEK